MLVVRRWLSTTALRVGSFAAHARWILLSLALAVAGLLDLVVPLPGAIGVTLALVSVVLLVLEVRAYAARQREMQFADRTGDAFADVRQQLSGRSRFRFVATPNGHVVLDLAAASAVRAGRVTAQVPERAYVLPRELHEPGVAFRRRRVARGATYNGHLLGLDTDLGDGDAPVPERWTLVAGRYWDHLSSDILGMKDVLVGGRVAGTPGRALSVSRDGRLRDFGESWLLNGIGTSVLALTTDARLVVVAQSNRNESSQGLVAPSGSGSLEPADMRDADTLAVSELVRNGALRELAEESDIPETEVASTVFLGLGRWLEKSAKPEFFTLAVLRIDSHEVRRRRVPKADRPYTLSVDGVPLHRDVTAWCPEDPTTVVDGEAAGRLSVPLAVGLHLLADAARDPASAVREALAALGDRLVVGEGV
jgi:hypothetical protein